MSDDFQNLPEEKYPRSYTPAYKRQLEAEGSKTTGRHDMYAGPKNLQAGERAMTRRKRQGPRRTKSGNRRYAAKR